MGRPKTIRIQEDLAELKTLVKSETNADIKDRLKLLYFYKQGESITKIAIMLMKSRASLFRWLGCYQEKGLQQYLESKTTRGAKRKFPEELKIPLIAAWQTKQVTSYAEASAWVRERNPSISYHVTRNFIRQSITSSH